MADTQVTPASLRIIRLAIAMGLLLLGVVAWYVSHQDSAAPMIDAASAQLIRYVFYGLTLSVFGVLVFLRQRVQTVEAYTTRVTLTIAGFAIGESVGIVGAVYLLLTGTVTFFVVGVLVLALAFVLFPLPKDG